MIKHLRRAIKLAGLRLSDVTVTQKGHFKLTVRGKVIACSGTPKDSHTAALRIAREMRRALS